MSKYLNKNDLTVEQIKEAVNDFASGIVKNVLPKYIVRFSKDPEQLDIARSVVNQRLGDRLGSYVREYRTVCDLTNNPPHAFEKGIVVFRLELALYDWTYTACQFAYPRACRCGECNGFGISLGG